MEFWKSLLSVVALLHGLFGGDDSAAVRTLSPGNATNVTPVFETTTVAKLGSENHTPPSSKILPTLSSIYSLKERHLAHTTKGDTLASEYYDSASGSLLTNTINSFETIHTEKNNVQTISGIKVASEFPFSSDKSPVTEYKETSTVRDKTSSPVSEQTSKPVTDQTVSGITVASKFPHSADESPMTEHLGTSSASEQTSSSKTVSGITVASEFPYSTDKSPMTVTLDKTTGVTNHTNPEPVPTQKPEPLLSHGGLAIIIIGCLLVTALVATTIAFFIKNSYAPPEAQRLRV